jgi:hypothetical protein
MGWVIKATFRPLYTRDRDQVQEAGGPQGRSGRVRKQSPPTGNRSPDRSEFLYRPTSDDDHTSLKGADELLPVLSTLLDPREGKFGTSSSDVL